jgi:acetone carboxylase gamma subunit
MNKSLVQEADRSLARCFCGHKTGNKEWKLLYILVAEVNQNNHSLT